MRNTEVVIRGQAWLVAGTGLYVELEPPCCVCEYPPPPPMQGLPAYCGECETWVYPDPLRIDPLLEPASLALLEAYFHERDFDPLEGALAALELWAVVQDHYRAGRPQGEGG